MPSPLGERRRQRARNAALLGAIVALAATGANAGRLEVIVDDGNRAVADAVVSLHAQPGRAPAGRESVMDQRDATFVPGVLAIQAGTSVRFPNSDRIQHQVYSFSPTRPFELPLYSGTPLAPVLFERPGVVVVGCNIHDWMIGWIVVLDTGSFGVTGADGRVVLDVPDGDYTLRVWQPRLKDARADTAVSVAGDATRRVALVLGPPLPDRRASDRLRTMQERLRERRESR